MAYGSCRIFLQAYFRLRHGLRVYGAENVPREGGVIIVSNHASFLDPPLIGCSLWHRNVCFMARDTLFQHAFGRWWANAVGVLPINRDKGDIRALKQAMKVVQHGDVLCLFPEGTRTRNGMLQAAKQGIGFLIEKSAVPVVPVFLQGTFQALPRGARMARPAKISVTFGAPLLPAEIGRFGNDPERRQKIADLIMARIDALRDAAAK